MLIDVVSVAWMRCRTSNFNFFMQLVMHKNVRACNKPGQHFEEFV